MWLSASDFWRQKTSLRKRHQRTTAVRSHICLPVDFFLSKIRRKRLLVDALLQVYREHLLIGPEEQRGKHLPLPSPQAVRGLNINSLLARQESSTSSGAVCIRLSLDYTFLLLLLHLFYPLSSVITIIIITRPLESCGSINLCKVVMLLLTTHVKKNLEDQSLWPFFQIF